MCFPNLPSFFTGEWLEDNGFKVDRQYLREFCSKKIEVMEQ